VVRDRRLGRILGGSDLGGDEKREQRGYQMHT
jgi:hypothetical protein